MDIRDGFSQALSDALTGAYKARRLTQDVVAERADMSGWTLQKKLKGRAPITATDLVVLARAIGVTPAYLIDEAEKLQREAMSEPPANVIQIRSKSTPGDGAQEDIDEQPSAANFDPEHEQDESDPT